MVPWYVVGLSFLLAGCGGGLLGALVYHALESKRWERLTGPIHTDLDDLHDQFMHFRKREAVRRHRGQGDPEPVSSELQRALERQRARRMGHGVLQETEKGSA